MNFYKRLFSKVKRHLSGGEYGVGQARRSSSALTQRIQSQYSGFKGNIKFGKDIASKIFRRMTFRD